MGCICQNSPMPKIIGDSLENHRALTRHKLFDALGGLLAEQSFDTITMSQIASRANVGRTAVYNHFEDKEVLLLAYMNEATAEFSALLHESIDAESDPIERLRIYVHAHLEMTSRYHLASRVHLRDQMSTEKSEHLHEHAGVIGNLLLTILIDAMKCEAIPVQDPHILVALIHACLSGQRLPSDPDKRRALYAASEAFVLRAVGASSEKIHALPSPKKCTEAEEHNTQASFMRCPVAH